MQNRSAPLLRTLAALTLAVAVCGGCADTPAGPVAPGAGFAAARVGDGYRYTTLQVPGSTLTQAFRINAQGHVAGTYQDGTGVHGFVRRGTSYQSIDFPGATATRVRGINERGDIVGMTNIGGKLHGFLLRDGEFSLLDFPGAQQTGLWDINANGEISGEYQPAAGAQWQGFVWRAGTFTPLALPNAFLSAGFGINQAGEVVGHVRFTQAGAAPTKMFGFVWRDGAMAAKLDHPVTNGMSCSQGIGDHGVAVGHYSDLAAGKVYGYAWRDGEFVARLEVPDAPETYPTSITQAGTIAGYYWSSATGIRGFIAEPLNPAGS